MAPTGSLQASFVRTLVPLIVGYVVSVAARHGWDVNDDQASSTITVAVTYVYYVLVRLLETHVDGRFGWLLGLAKPPHYPTVTPPSAE